MNRARTDTRGRVTSTGEPDLAVNEVSGELSSGQDGNLPTCGEGGKM